MDAFRGIPNLVADLIARIIPGSLVLLAANYALDFRIIDEISARFSWTQDNILLMTAFIVLITYVAGSLIDTLGSVPWDRYVPRRGLSSRLLEQAIIQPDASRFPPVVLQELQKEFLTNIGTDIAPDRLDPEIKKRREAKGMNKGRFDVATYLMYDWLTMYKPEAGARASKFFAEVIMFRSLTTVAAATFAAHLASLPFRAVPVNLMLLGLSLVVVVISTSGMLEKFRTFQILVIQQYYVARRWPTPGSGSHEGQDSKPDQGP